MLTNLLEKVEKVLKIPKEKIIEQGVQRFLESEVKNFSAEIAKIGIKYGVNSFNELWNKFERGEVSESECFDDLTKLEYLELEKEKILNLLREVKG